MPSIGPTLPPHLQAGVQPTEDSDGDDYGPSIGPSIGPALPKQHEAGPQLPAGPQHPPSIGAQIPSSVTSPSLPATADSEDDDEDAYMPELPPDLAPAKPTARMQGPAMPPGVGARYVADDDSDDDFGPMPLPGGLGERRVDPVQEFRAKEEARRKAAEEAAKPKKVQRDEWMLKPPTSSDLLANIDPTKIVRGGRRFNASSKSASTSKDVDSTLWTETPAERQQRLADEVAGKRRRAENAAPAEDEGTALERAKRRRREEEVRRGVDAHTAQHRGASLLDQHGVSSSSKLDPNEPPPGIWDHSRDMALSGRLLDDKSRERIVKDARGLSDRFGSGKSGGFL